MDTSNIFIFNGVNPFDNWTLKYRVIKKRQFMAAIDYINQLKKLEESNSTGSPQYRMLIDGLKKYHNIDWEEYKEVN